MKIGILGGGLTGLSLGNLLEHEFEILEKNEECGGLCRTQEEDGFVFDYGGCHILFSRDREALGFILQALGDNKVENRRNSKIHFRGRYVKYPFENGMADLPPGDNFECLFGFIQVVLRQERGDLEAPRNFKEWCYYTFGKGIAEKYLIPYNEKIWKFDTEAMSADWVKDRVPQPTVEDIVKSAVGVSTEGYTHQLYYYYPRRGGIQAAIRSLEAPIAHRITTDFEVKAVGRQGQGWLVSDGNTSRHYDRLVSTIPIFDLAKALGEIPVEVSEALGRLKYNRLITVLVGLNVPKLNEFTALYVPDSDTLPHRLGFLSNFSPEAAPEGTSSILAEVTCPPNHSDVWQSADEQVIGRVVDDLARLGVIPGPEKVCYTSLRRMEYAYVIYDHDYYRSIKVVRDYMSSLGITLVGRFSQFEYLNMDACVRWAMGVAAEIDGG